MSSWSNIFVYNFNFQFIFGRDRKTNIYVYLQLCRTLQIEFWIFCLHTSWANQPSKYAKYIKEDWHWRHRCKKTNTCLPKQSSIANTNIICQIHFCQFAESPPPAHHTLSTSAPLPPGIFCWLKSASRHGCLDDYVVGKIARYSKGFLNFVFNICWLDIVHRIRGRR